MRLQRKDLAKEFELIVKQEIINHNDSILATNISLEDFRSKLSIMNEKLNRSIDKTHGEFVDKHTSISLLEERFSKSVDKCLREFHDVEAFCKEMFSKIKKSIDDRETYFLTLEGFDNFKEKVDQWISNIQLSFSRQKDSFSQEIKTASATHQSSIDKLKEEIRDQFKKEQNERKQIEKNLDEFAINFSGVAREIEICKKRCFIIEKNIENVYTQIERSKEER